MIGGQFDSLLAKLIVTGSDRAQALERSRRALAEFQVEGMATVLPFHRLVVDDPAFADRRASPCTPGGSRPSATTPSSRSTDGGGDRGRAGRGSPWSSRSAARRLEVSLPGDLALGGGAGRPRPRRRRPGKRGGSGSAAASGDAVTAPMQGTIVKVAVADGDTVAAGDLVVVLEAMKMENPVTAHKAGTVTGLSADGGQLRRAGHGALRDQGLGRGAPTTAPRDTGHHGDAREDDRHQAEAADEQAEHCRRRADGEAGAGHHRPGAARGWPPAPRPR